VHVRYLYLLFSLFSLGCLGVLHKVADHRQCRPAAVNLLLFLVAGVLSSVFCLWQVGPAAAISMPREALAGGIVCGVFASLAVLVFQHGVRYGKISTSWLIIQLSAAVPTVLSIVLYGEVVGLKKACSLLLAVLSLVLLWIDRRREERGAAAAAANETLDAEAAEETA
jgi:drug/metabolite transporter (DMT)-like permease